MLTRILSTSGMFLANFLTKSVPITSPFVGFQFVGANKNDIKFKVHILSPRTGNRTAFVLVLHRENLAVCKVVFNSGFAKSTRNKSTEYEIRRQVKVWVVPVLKELPCHKTFYNLTQSIICKELDKYDEEIFEQLASLLFDQGKELESIYFKTPKKTPEDVVTIELISESIGKQRVSYISRCTTFQFSEVEPFISADWPIKGQLEALPAPFNNLLSKILETWMKEVFLLHQENIIK